MNCSELSTKCRVDDDTAQQMKRQSQTSDTGKLLTDKMARSMFAAVKNDLELQMEEILTRIILDIKDQARGQSDERYLSSKTRYKRDYLPSGSSSHEMRTSYKRDSMPSGSSFHEMRTRYKREDNQFERSMSDLEQSMYRSSGRRKPMRKGAGNSGNSDRKEQRIYERRSRRLQVTRIIKAIQ